MSSFFFSTQKSFKPKLNIHFDNNQISWTKLDEYEKIEIITKNNPILSLLP